MRDFIFDEDEIWDRKPIQYSVDDIKELDEAIRVIEVPQSEEMEDIQLGEVLEIDSATANVRSTAQSLDRLEFCEISAVWPFMEYRSPG